MEPLDGITKNYYLLIISKPSSLTNKKTASESRMSNSSFKRFFVFSFFFFGRENSLTEQYVGSVLKVGVFVFSYKKLQGVFFFFFFNWGTGFPENHAL